MEVLKNENGILLVRQYDRSYLRFMAGQLGEMLYQIEITDSEVSDILSGSQSCEQVLNQYENNNLNLPDVLSDKLIKDYLDYKTDYSEKRKNSIIEKLHKYGDIYYEFYYYVMRETFEDGVEESGFCASKLVKEYPLSPLGAYNYLIYLREKPAEAIRDLKAGLLRK